MNNRVYSFLAALQGKFSVINYFGKAIEVTRIFNELDFCYNNLTETYYLSNEDDDVHSFKFIECEVKSIDVDADHIEITFYNDDTLEVWSQL